MIHLNCYNKDIRKRKAVSIMELVILAALFGSIGFVGACDALEKKLRAKRRTAVKTAPITVADNTITVADKKRTA